MQSIYPDPNSGGRSYTGTTTRTGGGRSGLTSHYNHNFKQPIVEGADTVAFFTDEKDEETSCFSVSYAFASHSLAFYLSLILTFCVIAAAIAYVDSSNLRQDLGRNVRTQCRDVNNALLIYCVLLVISTAFAWITISSWFFIRSMKIMFVLFSVMLWITCMCLLIFTVIATVWIASPYGVQCRNIGNETFEVYTVVLAISITMWITFVTPYTIALIAWFKVRLNELRAEYAPKASPIKTRREAERDVLLYPAHRVIRVQ